MYLPSLYFCDGSYACSYSDSGCISCRVARKKSNTYVFPAQSFPALDAVDFTDRVVAGGHLSVHRLTLDDINAMTSSAPQSIPVATEDSHDIEEIGSAVLASKCLENRVRCMEGRE